MGKMEQLFDLSGKTAIITGASKGIGKAIAELLGAYGAQVVVSSRKLAAIEEVVIGLREKGVRAAAIAANMGKTEDIEHLVSGTLERFGGIDIIVNNAAANPVFGPSLQTEAWAYDKIMDVNVKGPFELCRLAHSYMKAGGESSIINISSVGGISPEDYLGIYSVSKAALISLTKVMAKEWGHDGIRANVICPGLIKTKFSRALWEDKDNLDRFIKKQPLPRIGVPEDIAGMALFLASKASNYCTGGVYTVDGGYTI